MAGNFLKRWAEATAAALFPDACEICGCSLTDGERHVCISCLEALPRTGFHTTPEANELHHKLSDNHVLVHRAASMFYYSRGASSTAPIISAKYRNMPSILSHLGEYYANEIKGSGFFDGIDAIIPVPSHWSRFINRGYNQTEYLARGLNRATGIPVALGAVKMTRSHSTQTRSTARERAENVRGAFRATPFGALLAGRHILVADDIITTGATLHECLIALARGIPGATLSVLSLGLAHSS